MAPLAIDVGSVHVGESMSIRWTGAYTGPIEDLIPPSDAWDPSASYDGTGLKYQNHIHPGSFDLGTCTVTAS